MNAGPRDSAGAASPHGRRQARSRTAGRVAAWAGRFWLGVFFRLVRASPALSMAIRPVLVRLAVFGSPLIRRNIAANARFLAVAMSSAERRAFTARVVAAFYDFVADVGRSQHATLPQLLGRISAIDGIDAYQAARAAGRGAVVLTAHLGSFEVGLAALVEREPNVHVVFRRDADDAFERLRSQLRQRLGVAEACVDDGPAVWMRLRSALLEGEVVAVQGDRALPGQRAITVPLLGGHVRLPTGPYKLAASAGAPVIPIFTTREPDGRIRVDIRPAIDVAQGEDVPAAANRYAVELERVLRRVPEQWLVLESAFVDCDSGDSAKPLLGGIHHGGHGGHGAGSESS